MKFLVLIFACCMTQFWLTAQTVIPAGNARQAIADLFATGGDTLEIIKWKEIYALLESAIDKCEDVANIIERIVIKQA